MQMLHNRLLHGVALGLCVNVCNEITARGPCRQALGTNRPRCVSPAFVYYGLVGKVALTERVPKFLMLQWFGFFKVYNFHSLQAFDMFGTKIPPFHSANLAKFDIIYH